MTSNRSNRKLTVLHLPKWYPSKVDPQNGVFIEKHINCISQNAFSIVVCAISSDAITSRFKIDTYRRETQNVVIGYFKPLGGLNPVLYLITFIRACRLGLKESRPNLIHAHVGFRTYLIGAVLKWIYSVPFVVTEHWSGYERGLFKKFPSWKKNLVFKAFASVDAISFVSSRLQKQVAASGILFKGLTEVIPNVIESNKSKLSISNPIPVLLVVADLKDEIKNISGILEVVSHLTNRSFDLRIAGDGDDKGELENMAQKLQIQRKVRFIGRIDNNRVYEELAQCSFLISNSRTETFGMVPLEALACGKPVICTTSGCPPEIQKETNGIFIEKDNNEMLKKAMEKMLDTYQDYEPEELMKVAQDYTPEKVGEMFQKLYTKVLNR